ncbi:Butyrophilin subfamily 3 member A3 Precursor [Channa argus]|uniref:Butyrophilin subfamily 3 member A3 n=1 Tax=Channa argus TaxID=215402 RepID=A0A6G1Q6J2_CHAAH|nr:Butyrophilin subfamily 3 member A3 Precursor [Channa argus]
MCNMKGGLSLTPQFGGIRLLVFHTIVFLVLLHPCRVQSEVVGPSQPIVATVGDDVILPCYLKPVTDIYGMTVEWKRPDLQPRFVLLWRAGLELETKHPSYKGRTSLFTEELKHGNISLKLSEVKISDEGSYRCFVPGLAKESTVKLVVGAVSSPDVQMTQNITGVVLQCESKGWYPEPEVFWLDGEGNVLSAGPTETVRGPDDLYTVSSRVTVDKRHGNQFTCRVQQNIINQTRETHIHVPSDFFSDLPGSASSAPVIIGSILGIMCLLAGALVVWKWRKNKHKNKKQHKDEEAEKDGEKSRFISSDPEQEVLLEVETDIELPAQRTTMETVNNSSSEETEHQTQTEEETHQRETNNVLMVKSGLDRVQKETETKPVNEKTDAPGLNNDKLETKSVRDNTATVMEGETVREQLTGNNLQTDDGEEVNSTADGTRDQGLMEEDKHGHKREERDTLNNLSTGKEKLTKKLKTKERELKKFEEQISKYIKQKKDKDQQIKELRVKSEEVKKKLQSVNREDETEKEKDQDVKGPLDTKNDLETEMEELQKKMKKMETQREIIIKEITLVTEKKMKVTHEIEEIIKMSETTEKEGE